eukprot:GHVO01027426.1.p1 GENE.GHVO01027426.1~~GHVO01027426.1.p1  ORF type:complete len:237 (-),score=13.22 GHVO01027426.1:63-773(-)
MAAAFQAPKIVLKSTTKMTLNERFTVLEQTRPKTSAVVQASTQRNAQVIRASQKEKRLAQQMANRPAVMAALGVKKRLGIKGRVGAPAAPVAARGSAKLRGFSTRGRGGFVARGRGITTRGRGVSTRGTAAGFYNTAQRGTRGRGRGRAAANGQSFSPRGAVRGMTFTRGGGRGAGRGGQSFRARGRGQLRGRGRGRGGRGGGAPRKDNLDTELDQYMSKTKTSLDDELDSYMSQN